MDATSSMEVVFPGGKQVQANLGKLSVLTDQAPGDGGQGMGPSPFLLFLASLATCAGYYVLAFCQSRDIPTDQIKLTQSWERDAKTKRLEKVKIEISLPPEFPEKYESAVIRTANLCTVKKVILDPPEMEVKVKRG